MSLVTIFYIHYFSFFFFKQKTAYELRISDWSSDVCSSDLWNDIWLDPAFRAWNIQEYLPRIRCPLLALQGVDDEYGTLEQIRGVGRAVPQARMPEIADCRHSPHTDPPEVFRSAARRAGKARFCTCSTRWSLDH